MDSRARSGAARIKRRTSRALVNARSDLKTLTLQTDDVVTERERRRLNAALRDLDQIICTLTDPELFHPTLF